jgi:hypothetical protein
MDMGKKADKSTYSERQLVLKVRNLLWKSCANQHERVRLRPEDRSPAEPPLPFLYQSSIAFSDPRGMKRRDLVSC